MTPPTDTAPDLASIADAGDLPWIHLEWRYTRNKRLGHSQWVSEGPTGYYKVMSCDSVPGVFTVVFQGVCCSDRYAKSPYTAAHIRSHIQARINHEYFEKWRTARKEAGHADE